MVGTKVVDAQVVEEQAAVAVARLVAATAAVEMAVAATSDAEQEEVLGEGRLPHSRNERIQQTCRQTGIHTLQFTSGHVHLTMLSTWLSVAADALSIGFLPRATICPWGYLSAHTHSETA